MIKSINLLMMNKSILVSSRRDFLKDILLFNDKVFVDVLTVIQLINRIRNQRNFPYHIYCMMFNRISPILLMIIPVVMLIRIVIFRLIHWFPMKFNRLTRMKNKKSNQWTFSIHGILLLYHIHQYSGQEKVKD